MMSPHEKNINLNKTKFDLYSKSYPFPRTGHQSTLSCRRRDWYHVGSPCTWQHGTTQGPRSRRYMYITPRCFMDKDGDTPKEDEINKPDAKQTASAPLLAVHMGSTAWPCT